MKENEFKIWLLKNGYEKSTAATRFSDAKRVEEYEGNLDKNFELDECNSLIGKLTYSKMDLRLNVPQKHSIPINAKEIYKKTASFKQAISRYVDFRKNIKRNIKKDIQVTKNNVLNPKTENKGSKPQGKWPIWDLPNDKQILELAKMVTGYCRFLKPEIIEIIVKDNEKNKQRWSEGLRIKGVEPELYLWEKSSCAFPGIRRYAGSKEIAAHRGHTKLDKPIQQALRLDDNNFPKHLWSFVFRGKEFQNFGPNGYSLAHLIDHKEYNNRMKDEFVFEKGFELDFSLYGLYTCPTNTIYIPVNMIKPTDFVGEIRQLLFRKAYSLYKDYCNILPTTIKIKENVNPDWDLDNFQWSEPVGSIDNLEQFFAYRTEKIHKLIS